jgi:hypothetical protein
MKIKKLTFKSVKLKTDKNCIVIENRQALLLKFKKPFIRWHKKIYPWRESDPKERIENALPTTILFMLKKNETHEKWLKKNYKRVFEEELSDRIGPKRDWPKKRNYATFRRYIDAHFSDLIIDDAAGKPIEMG